MSDRPDTLTHAMHHVLLGVMMAETFPVSFLGSDSDREWLIDAGHPEEAIDQAVAINGFAEGTYSVWDSTDPWGMPLIEREISS